MLKSYTTVIFGGGLYANRVNGLGGIIKKRRALEGKRLFIYTCGLSDPAREADIKKIQSALRKRLPPKMRDTAELFHLRGGIRYSRLRFPDSLLMRLLKKTLQRKKPEKRSKEENEMLAALGSDIDFTRREAIAPLVQRARAAADRGPA